MEDTSIKHVSDTAIWVATYRAEESERPNALFKDPLARVLVGERGPKIARSMPYSKLTGWILVLRTVVIDRFIQTAIKNGIDTVINLGAGLDTRPYRMHLPSTLNWIEVDFLHMIEYKNQTLQNEKPVCQLERIAADLSQDAERKALFQKLGSRTQKALILTEGVIPYLTSEDAEKLSIDLFAIPTFAYWVMDYRNGIRRYQPKRLRKALKDSPFKFDVLDTVSFFQKQGWKVGEKVSTGDESQRLKRPMPFLFPWSLLIPFMGKKNRDLMREASGYLMYAR